MCDPKEKGEATDCSQIQLGPCSFSPRVQRTVLSLRGQRGGGGKRGFGEIMTQTGERQESQREALCQHPKPSRLVALKTLFNACKRSSWLQVRSAQKLGSLWLLHRQSEKEQRASQAPIKALYTVVAKIVRVWIQRVQRQIVFCRKHTSC